MSGSHPRDLDMLRPQQMTTESGSLLPSTSSCHQVISGIGVMSTAIIVNLMTKVYLLVTPNCLPWLSILGCVAAGVFSEAGTRTAGVP